MDLTPLYSRTQRRFKPIGAFAAALFLLVAACGHEREPVRDRELAWKRRPVELGHTDHARLLKGPFAAGPAVTRACLQCHSDEAREVMATSHWTWLGDRVEIPDTGKRISIGKANVINNFCIAVGPNMPRCTTCHAGYGWQDDSFDFDDPTKVDCLTCHDTTGTYRKGLAGRVQDDVDLVSTARKVGRPTRTNCGGCHFAGGGGDAVKHGDMDGSMYFPAERIDIHMGGHDFSCQTCHRTTDHRIPGCAMSVCPQRKDRIACTDCHRAEPHLQERLDAHTAAVACQTCHVPRMAIHWATKMSWDWSEAGKDLPINDPHVYLKAKGRFTYARDVAPEYYWYDGLATRYLIGDPVNRQGITNLNYPRGDITQPRARLWPFKVHRGKQPYDTVHGYLLVPRTYGEGGYWTEFDWDKANRIGMEIMNLPYSGEYDFAETAMYWPLSHMVQRKDKALQCRDCHGAGGRMDWKALGYGEDPAFLGGRRQQGLLAGTGEAGTGGEAPRNRRGEGAR